MPKSPDLENQIAATLAKGPPPGAGPTTAPDIATDTKNINNEEEGEDGMKLIGYQKARGTKKPQQYIGTNPIAAAAAKNFKQREKDIQNAVAKVEEDRIASNTNQQHQDPQDPNENENDGNDNMDRGSLSSSSSKKRRKKKSSSSQDATCGGCIIL